MSFGFGVGDFIAVLDKAKLYRERFADAPDHFDSLSREIASLTSILEYVGRLEAQLTEDEKKALAAPIKESTKLLGELENIYNDSTSLETHEDTNKLPKLKPRAVWRRLRMKPEDVQKLRQRITMNAHFLSAIKGFRDSETIHTTKQVVTLMHDEQTSRQEREILDWLTTTDYAPQQRDHLARRHTGTNQWLLDSEEYKSWVSTKSQTLLCPGMPGAGKTIMASVIVDDLLHRYQNDSNVGIAYVYCNFKDQERQNHFELLSSITKQLGQCQSPIPGSLKELYETHQTRKTLRTLQDTIDVLQAVSSSYIRIFIVIDALDECGSKSRQALLSEVFRLQRRHPTNILATTRDIPDIVESAIFQNVTVLRILASDGDVSRYISSRIPGMQGFVQRRADIQEEIQKGILCKINGMFLLAKLLVDSLACKTTPKAIRKALAAASAEYDTYAYFYEEALERIRVQPPSYVQLANHVLSWIVFAMRPLKMNELQHALAVEEDEPEIDEDNIPSAEIMISACAGLVTLDEQGGIIRLVHQTTQEFFSSRKHDLFRDVDAQIAVTCVRYLFLGQVRDSINKRTGLVSSWRKPYLRRNRKSLRELETPFCDYAILHWGLHAGYCDTIPANVIGLLRNQEMLARLATISSELLGENVPSLGAHLAAWFGLLQVFTTQTLPADRVSFVDNKGQSILSWAAYRGHYGLVEHILEDDTLQLKSCHDQSRDQCFQTALLKAVKRKNSDVAHRLIRFALDQKFDFKSTNDPSLLLLGIEQGNVTMIRHVLEWSRLGLSDIQNSTPIGLPLAFAASRGCDDAVRLLLDNGANIEALDQEGRSPLLRAAKSGYESTVNILLQYGAKVSSQSGRQSAVWSAQRNGHVSVVRLLITSGACIESRNETGMTVLSSAAGAGQLSMLLMLLNHNANIEARDTKGYTPLWHALTEWQESTFKVLLERGANTEAMDMHGDTPLLFAAKNSTTSGFNTFHRSQMLKTLLNYKAAIEVKDSKGRTPLSIAAGIRRSLAFTIVLQYGPVIETLDEKHRTPLWYASTAGSIASVETLEECGAGINCGDIDNVTPILTAAEAGRGLLLEKLTGLGADLTVNDKFGRTALLIAAGAGRDSVLSTDDLKKRRRTGDRRKSPKTIAWVRKAILGNPLLCQQLMGVRDYQGRTPLWWTITSGRTKLLKHLSKVVDEVEVLDRQGRPPLINSTENHHVGKVVQLLLEHVSQFGSNGERLRSHDGMTAKAIRYVRSFLEFNEIDTNRDFFGGLRDVWLNIKPGDPIPQRTLDESSSDSCHEFLFDSSDDLSLNSVDGVTRARSTDEIDEIDWVDSSFNWDDVKVDELDKIDGLERCG